MPGAMVVIDLEGPAGAPEPEPATPLHVLLEQPRLAGRGRQAGRRGGPPAARRRARHAGQRGGGPLPGVRRGLARPARGRRRPPARPRDQRLRALRPRPRGLGAPATTSCAGGRWRRSTWRWWPAGSRRAASARCRWRSAAAAWCRCRTRGAATACPREGATPRPAETRWRGGAPLRPAHPARGAHRHRRHAPDPRPPGLPRPPGGGRPRSTAATRRRCPGSTATSCTPGGSGFERPEGGRVEVESPLPPELAAALAPAAGQP